MIKTIDMTDLEIAKLVLNVQLLSYKVEAELIGYDDIPPLKDTIDTLQRCGETFIGYVIDDMLCGVLSYKFENDVIDIHRLIVHPSFFRKGIANALLQYIEKNNQYKTIKVATGSKNVPAINLYLKHGFLQKQEIKINTQLSLCTFEKYK